MNDNRVTREELEALVKNPLYIVEGTMTICILELKCGFKLTGMSACIDPVNFDAMIGQNVSYNNAFEQLWQLEGYHRMRATEEA